MLPDSFHDVESTLPSFGTASPDAVCTPQMPIACSSTTRQSAITKAFSARQKKWESEQASELSKCDKFLLVTRGCTLTNGKPCSSLFSREYLIDTRAQSFLLSREQLDILLLGSVASTVCDDDDVGVRSGHRPAKRQRRTIEYMHKGYHVCRNTFTFLHGVGKHKVQAIKRHFLDNGISTREHGNNGNHPKHALTFSMILGILQFIQNYAEQHAILLPGRIPGFKQDNVKVLPSSDTKKVFLQ